MNGPEPRAADPGQPEIRLTCRFRVPALATGEDMQRLCVDLVTLIDERSKALGGEGHTDFPHVEIKDGLAAGAGGNS